MTSVRHDTALIATNEPTMGIKLLCNELAGGSTHIHAPKTRSDQASRVYNLIHPDHGKREGDSDMPRTEIIHRSMFSYLVGESNLQVVNVLIGHLGRTNIALAVKPYIDVKSPVRLPMVVVPLAGLFVSCPDLI